MHPSPTKSKKNKDSASTIKKQSNAQTDLLEVFNELYPATDEYKQVLDLVINICKEFPELTNTASYYLIGKRHRIDISKSTEKCSHAKITDDYSAAYEINRSTVYSYSLFSKHMDIIRSKSESCFYHLVREDMHHSYRNIKKLSDLSETELTSLSKYIEENPDHGSYADIVHQLSFIQKQTLKENVENNSSVPYFTSKHQDNIPIKNLPAFDPDAELASLTFTIPTWVSSTRRARKNTQINQTSHQARNQLRNQLYELEDAVTLMLMFIDGEDSNNGK